MHCTHKHLYPSPASHGYRDYYLVSFGRASPFAKALLSALADESVGPCCSYFRYFTLSVNPHQSTATTFYTPADAPALGMSRVCPARRRRQSDRRAVNSLIRQELPPAPTPLLRRLPSLWRGGAAASSATLGPAQR